MIRIISTLGGLAAKYVRPLTEGWMGGDWMNSAGLYSRQSGS